MAEHQDERRIQDGDGIFQAGDRLVAGKISGHAANEEIASAGIEGVFRRDARIGAAQDGGEGILTSDQGLPLTLEIVTPRFALGVALIAFHEPLERGIG